MQNNIFQVRAAALNHLKTHGFTSKFTLADIRDLEEEDTERLWEVHDLFEIKLHSTPRPKRSADTWARFTIDILVGSNEKPNRAWYKYQDIHLDPNDQKSVFSIQKGQEPKQIIVGVHNLIQWRPTSGTFTLRLEQEGPAFTALQKRAGFLDLTADRKALIDGVLHMKRNQKIPFDFTTLPSEELPWIIECCGRAYQNWNHRQASAKFWNDIVKKSNDLKNFTDFLD